MEGFKLDRIEITHGEIGFGVKAFYTKKAPEANSNGYFSQDFENRKFFFPTLELALTAVVELYGGQVVTTPPSTPAPATPEPTPAPAETAPVETPAVTPEPTDTPAPVDGTVM